ncbi:MAG TPA: hypothetical protein VKJ47_00705 [Candidatus Binatia bacterium]|nr:hypothetical protein [Candidatus Binatia bacterium]
MAVYPDALTVGEARARYFAANGFAESGYEARWVRLQAGPVPLFIPNTSARARAVRFHDLHHVATGYDTTWTGEAEIGAWEVASGCAHHYAAWVLNLQALAVGLLINPGAVFRAFLRGRHSRNLYRKVFSDSLLAPTVGEMRRRLHLDTTPRPPTPRDCTAFAGWALAGALVFLLSLFTVLAPLLAAWIFLFHS